LLKEVAGEPRLDGPDFVRLPESFRSAPAVESAAASGMQGGFAVLVRLDTDWRRFGESG
jgi:hypothetical protein